MSEQSEKLLSAMQRGFAAELADSIELSAGWHDQVMQSATSTLRSVVAIPHTFGWTLTFASLLITAIVANRVDTISSVQNDDLVAMLYGPSDRTITAFDVLWKNSSESSI